MATTYLEWSAPALYLDTLARVKGSEAASSQRFSYFGSLAGGGGGDGACEEHKTHGLAVSRGRACRQRGRGLNTGEEGQKSRMTRRQRKNG